MEPSGPAAIPAGAVQLTVATALAAPLAEKLPVSIKNRYPMIHFIGDVQLLLAVEGHADRPSELGVPGARPVAKFVEVVLVKTADTNANGGGPGGVAAVQHKYAPVATDGKIVGIGIATAIQAIVDNADGLYVVQRYAGRLRLSGHLRSPLPSPPP